MSGAEWGWVQKTRVREGRAVIFHDFFPERQLNLLVADNTAETRTFIGALVETIGGGVV